LILCIYEDVMTEDIDVMFGDQFLKTVN
jgi:hypothetical protein